MIVYYDHLITFDSEYRYVWRKIRSPSSWLFLINRYFAFFSVCSETFALPCDMLIDCDVEDRYMDWEFCLMAHR